MFTQYISSLSRKFTLLILALTLSLSVLSVKATPCELIKVVDADTLLVNKIIDKSKKEEIKIRLLGVDAPEFTQELWGKRAREFVVAELARAEALDYELDHDKKDRYGRTLAYVFYTVSDKQLNAKKKKLLNEELLRNGFAELYMNKENSKYSRVLKSAEASARFSQINIWQKQGGLEMSPSKFRKSKKKPAK
jgi:micrococcal nuclease